MIELELFSSGITIFLNFNLVDKVKAIKPRKITNQRSPTQESPRTQTSKLEEEHLKQNKQVPREGRIIRYKSPQEHYTNTTLMLTLGTKIMVFVYDKDTTSALIFSFFFFFFFHLTASILLPLDHCGLQGTFSFFFFY